MFFSIFSNHHLKQQTEQNSCKGLKGTLKNSEVFFAIFFEYYLKNSGPEKNLANT